MMDISPSVTFFEVNLPSKEVGKNVMVFSGCNAYLKSAELGTQGIYSELEEISFSHLNDNDTGYRKLEIEFCFRNNQKSAYQCFWANCFSVRTENGVVIKVARRECRKAYTKVNMNGDIVLGVGFFVSKEHYEKLVLAETMIIEGLLALGKCSNTYGVSVKIEKENEDYEIKYANTYQLSKRCDIRNIAH